jgi:hypothetical protein
LPGKEPFSGKQCIGLASPGSTEDYG